MKTTAIIVAGGSGRRMRQKIPKQYLEIAGRPVIGHTLATFDACADLDEFVIVVPATDITFVRTDILPSLGLRKPVTLVNGGKERQNSVYNGLMSLNPSIGIVVIHDAVRPFVTPAQISDSIQCIRNGAEACLFAIPAVETLKQADHHGRVVKTIPRERIYCAQTPQTFNKEVIRSVHEKARAQHYLTTDDAALVEHYGGTVEILPGWRFNIKLTTPEDFFLAEAFMRLELFATTKSFDPLSLGAPANFGNTNTRNTNQ